MKSGVIVLQSWDKLELVKRVQDLEKRGYTCVSRIIAIQTSSREFEYKGNSTYASGYTRKFEGRKDRELYKIKMKKEHSA